MTDTASGADTPTIPGRAARIAAVHMSAHWLAEHQDVLAPTKVEMRHHISFVDEPDVATRLAAIDAFARAHGTEVVAGGSTMWTRVELATAATHGVDVDYVLVTSVANPTREAWDR